MQVSGVPAEQFGSHIHDNLCCFFTGIGGTQTMAEDGKGYRLFLHSFAFGDVLGKPNKPDDYPRCIFYRGSSQGNREFPAALDSVKQFASPAPFERMAIDPII